MSVASLVRLPASELARATEVLTRLGLGHRSTARVGTLSGGERQRVAIGRALVQGASVILADELVAHLDPATADGIFTDLRALAHDGVSFLLTTHEPGVASAYADRAAVLRDGAIAVLATTAESLSAALAG
ncbi:MAG: ATP-binding cassette domain-containing protein [Chloroflexi bacterium]|nr:ATP-binding cassette domain-containing protein [Chloroflexota bacterium]